jgi:nucleoside 2-deoxyribosyltransferase
MKTIYYAHSISLYGSLQEERDMLALIGLGFEVVNPSDHFIQEEVDLLPTSEKRMAFFEKYSIECDAIAFRALPDGAIPSGVVKEIGWFQALGKPVIELPSSIKRRELSVELTREYLHEVGQR